MNERKPRVFVSSTIYDFRDLRSAIKLWLEEYGYEVLMSDLNDFRQSPDQNSYQSCLQAIDDCDYFILLIGGRVGGWYDRENRISITRMEYRHAYERLKVGKLKLIGFVRKEIWDIREDRNSLKKYLEDERELDKELTQEQKADLVNHPSKFLNDAECIFDFLNEVGRIEEMKQAVNVTGLYPIGNWIYQFSSLKDIIDACKVVLNLSGNLRQQALVTNLKYELKDNLCELLNPFDDTIKPVTAYSGPARASLKGGWSESSSYTGNHLIWLGMFLMIGGNVGKRLRATALTEAITSGEFLDFDKKAGTHKVGLLQKAMMDLEEHVTRLRGVAPSDLLDVSMKLLKNEQYKEQRKSIFSVENHFMAGPFAFHDLVENAIALSKAIYQTLEGDT
jgi:hypothetical protein